MDDYNVLRQLADSWGLVYLFGMFVAVIVFVYCMPGSKEHAEYMAKIPLREDDIDD